MNEKIKAIYNQAARYAYEQNPGENSYGRPVNENKYNEDLYSKFAELIVKECANGADMAYDARCEYVGDYVAEFMGYGEKEGIATWRAN